MDTTKHLEVALAAHGKWLDSRVDTREAPEIAVAALDSNGLLCTEVESEFIEAWLALAVPGVPYPGPESRRYDAARDALLAERAGKPVEPREPVTTDDWRGVRAEMQAEIASLKEQLAEATRPRKVWHEAEQSRISPQRWRVWRYADERRGSGVMTKDEVLSVRGDAAESIARAHAAKLDAEQGGQS